MAIETRHVLCISEDPLLFQNFERLMGEQGTLHIDLIRVFPAAKAVPRLSQEDFDLILLDVFDLKEAIPIIDKILKISPKVPVVALISFGFGSMGDLIKAGAIDVFEKNFEIGSLLRQKIFSIIERGRAERMNEIRDEILEAVNLAAETFLLDPAWEKSMGLVLGRLGQATLSDRVYVFKNGREINSGLELFISADWASDGVRSKKESTMPVVFTYEEAGLDRWKQELSVGNIIYGGLDDLPEVEKKTLAGMDVKSLVAAPIFVDQEWWGFIGFDQCKTAQGWTRVQIDALRTAANILGAALSRQAAEKRLTFLATHDFLTNLPNRMLFEDRFHQAAAHADRSGDKVAVISLDLDKFKSVNDNFGHPVGDVVLKEVGNRLTHAIRESDTCARIGGDEFGIIAETIHNKADAIKVMKKLLNTFENPISIEGREICLSASMGAALYPNHGNDLETIMKAADRALYEIKGKRSAIKIFEDPQMPLIDDA